MLEAAHTHPKMRRLCAALRPMLGNSPVSPQTVCVGLLERLWHYVAHNHRDGILRGVDAALLAEEIGWQEDADKLLVALIQCGWIDQNGSEIAIHDWAEHCPRWCKGVNARKAKKTTQFATQLQAEFATQLQTESVTQSAKNADLVANSQDTRHKTQDIEAKASVLSASPSAGEVSPPPTNGSIRPAKILLDDAKLDELQADSAYSRLNVRDQFSRCSRWCEANRQQLSYRRFITWLNRSAEQLPQVSQDTSKPKNYRDGWEIKP
jgi:hypothetical protein